MENTITMRIDSPAAMDRLAELLIALLDAGMEFEAEEFDGRRMIIHVGGN